MKLIGVVLWRIFSVVGVILVGMLWRFFSEVLILLWVGSFCLKLVIGV